MEDLAAHPSRVQYFVRSFQENVEVNCPLCAQIGLVVALRPAVGIYGSATEQGLIVQHLSGVCHARWYGRTFLPLMGIRPDEEVFSC